MTDNETSRPASDGTGSDIAALWRHAHALKDADRLAAERIYDAEASFGEGHDPAICGHDAHAHLYRIMTVQEMEAFASDTLEAIGFTGALPTIDIGNYAPGWAASDGVHGHISFGPDMAHAMAALHELAHHMEPRALHGPSFVVNYINLIGVALGNFHQLCMLEEFDHYEVAVDSHRLLIAGHG